MEFAEAAKTPIPGDKVVNIEYLLILRTGKMEKSCEQWEDMQVELKTWQAFKDHFAQAYRNFYTSCPEDQKVCNIDHFISWDWGVSGFCKLHS